MRGKERAVGRCTGDEAELLGPHCIARDELQWIPEVTCRTREERSGTTPAAQIHYGTIHGLQHSHFGREAYLSGIIGLENCLDESSLVQLLLRLLSEALTIYCSVMKDCDLLTSEPIR